MAHPAKCAIVNRGSEELVGSTWTLSESRRIRSHGMRNVLLLVVIVLAVLVGWQIGGVYVENYEFSSDVKDLAAQNNARTGLEPIATEPELKSAVMASARQHGIHLVPDHLTVHRTLTPATFAANGTLETPTLLDISIAADYDAPINLLGLSFNIHFAPTSSHNAAIIAK